MFPRLRSLCLLAAVYMASLDVAAAALAQGQNRTGNAASPGNACCLGIPTKFGTDAAPIVVKTISQPKSDAEVAQEKQDREQRNHNDHLLLAFNGVLAVFTIVLAGSTIFLWLETRGLRTLGKQQAEDMKESLALTKLSVDAAVALELPLFVIESTQIEPQNSTATVSLGNHGRTPAIITKTCLVAELDHALPPKPCYPMHDVEEIPVSSVVEKGHEFKISRSSTLSENDWKRVFDQQTILWVYGYLEYIDFLKTKRRTGFCLAFMPRPDKFYPSMPSRSGDWVQEGPSTYSYDRTESDTPSEGRQDFN